ncbi:hypothetical protein VR7878_03696 [Vibrio ruber DSM 16370]|uniref:Uncharacterized protein n=1 Tax=Vibrio ruber (strain DSM 16370 / JCM 11486 / BCRC 17186 / CECT 7878 / LMG 23124 / VR1) TaxID=1123498 RepID=A0A1R4LTT0_VIBR1|nr:hypothetical protein [Vibrio ruber]SJN59799.1 hypothetical protein VR7878_03696 [Vibrio ruber DSM 16370]
MKLDNDQIQDKLIHAKANYWILTLICGGILSLFVNKVSQLEFDGVAVCYALLFVGVSTACIKLSAYIKNLKQLMLK